MESSVSIITKESVFCGTASKAICNYFEGFMHVQEYNHNFNLAN